MDKEEITKQKNIEIILEILKKASPVKVSELLIFIQNYTS